MPALNLSQNYRQIHFQSQEFCLKNNFYIANFFHKEITGFCDSNFKIFAPLGFPFKRLIGLKKPAIAIELGIAFKDSIDIFVEPVCSSILKLLSDNNWKN